MNEAETRAELIDPILAKVGWGRVEGSKVNREKRIVITPGRLIGNGKHGKQDIADYVLSYHGQKLAVIEAKRNELPATEGLDQAKRYAKKLDIRFTYATNGITIYKVDMLTGHEGEVDHYPTPDELWAETFAVANQWRNRFAAVPFEDKSGTWEARYYQHTAINKALEAIIAGNDRILLTLATGTGKTFIAFQLAWKLFQSHWNIHAWKNDVEQSKRRPRILFLADRNILADQAFNAFSAFPKGALVRIKPNEIKKNGQVPTNGSVFFTIFQTFMSGSDEQGNALPHFGQYDANFFDFIIIDECHRGGANDESNWRGILDHFSSAVQLGLTATPRIDDNVDTYDYFGKPVYIYSLKDGINDGFLSPFRVKQIATTLDDYVHKIDNKVIQGEIKKDKYEEKDFNRTITIPEREAYRVSVFMNLIKQHEKTIVFCATQNHALMVRDFINQQKGSSEPDYCVRVTADDGDAGEMHLRYFQDNDKTIPTILTTSRKLSTGVDARNVRNIVLMRPVTSMIEFKQIIGRGTRLFDKKDYFTVYDFVKAYENFKNPEWDGEPICGECNQYPCECAEKPPAICKKCNQPKPCDCEPDVCKKCGEYPCCCVCDECGERPCVCSCKTCHQKPCVCKVIVQLSPENKIAIQDIMVTTFWNEDGQPITAAQFIKNLYGILPDLFNDEDKLRSLWSQPDTRKKLLSGLEGEGFSLDCFNEIKTIIDAEHSDIYDVLASIAFASPRLTREERANQFRQDNFQKYNDQQQDFLSFVLNHYVAEGVKELETERLPDLLRLKYGSTTEAFRTLGKPDVVNHVFVGFQKGLYLQHATMPQ